MGEAECPEGAWDPHLYDHKHSFVWKHGAALLDLLAPRSGEAILDLGCGTGHLTAQIAAAGAAVIGLDNSPAMVEEARRTYPNFRFEIGDARCLSSLEQFDAVFSNAALHWIPDAEAVVHGVARALKLGGRFVAEFGGRGNVRAIAGAMHRATQALGLGSPESPWYFPGIAEYAALLERHGLEVTFATLFDRPTPLEGEAGLRHWVQMFGGHVLSRVPPERREDFFRDVEDAARPVLFREGRWVADYRRLRVVACRVESGRAPAGLLQPQPGWNA
jgi:trans-aconitate methyltransferase